MFDVALLVAGVQESIGELTGGYPCCVGSGGVLRVLAVLARFPVLGVLRVLRVHVGFLRSVPCSSCRVSVFVSC